MHPGGVVMDTEAVTIESTNKVFGGRSAASKAVDAFVACHSIVAFSFACFAVFYPAVFNSFSLEENPFAEGTYAADAVRWSSPFVFGFSFFAFSSLFADGKSRRNVANVFVCAFTMAAAIGFWTQFNGRWNSFHGLNIFLFAALAIVYAFFLIFFPQAFDRKTKKLP